MLLENGDAACLKIAIGNVVAVAFVYLTVCICTYWTYGVTVESLYDKLNFFIVMEDKDESVDSLTARPLAQSGKWIVIVYLG